MLIFITIYNAELLLEIQQRELEFLRKICWVRNPLPPPLHCYEKLTIQGLFLVESIVQYIAKSEMKCFAFS